MKVTIENVGVFEINEEKLHKLLSFLSELNGIKLQESNTVYERNDNGFTGRQLL